MKVTREEIIGASVVAVLLWLLYHLSSAPTADSAGLPETTRGTPFTIPQLTAPQLVMPSWQTPPDLKPWVKTGGSNPTVISSVTPCDCACTDPSDMLQSSIQGLIDNLSAVGKTAMEDYSKSLDDALPGYVKQFLENPDAAKAARVSQAKSVAFSYAGQIANPPPQQIYELGAKGWGLYDAVPLASAGDYYSDFLKGAQRGKGPQAAGRYAFEYHLNASSSMTG